MKALIKRWLKRYNVYEYLKYSYVFRLYEAIWKPYVIRQHQKEVALYRAFLPACDLIFDIGAYDGHKTAAFLATAKRVIACEPDPFHARVLAIRFRNQRKRVTVVQKAVSNRSGSARLLVHHSGSAFNTLNPHWKALLEADNLQRWDEKVSFDKRHEIDVQTTTLDALIATYGVPDFIKIDVEGHEKEVFEGLHHQVKCVSFECLMPEFKPELLHIIRRFHAMDPGIAFNVIHREALYFPSFVGFDAILAWIEACELVSFDLVMQST